MSQSTDATLDSAAETAINQCLALGAEESCAVVTDDERLPIGRALYDAARAVTDEVVLLQYPPGDQHGTEPPAPVAAAMRGADVVFCPTTKSLSHTRARSGANEAGARVATLPGITESVFTTGLDTDYRAIEQSCETVLDAVADASEVRVTSPAGTDITFEPGEHEWLADTGIVHEAGAMSNLPAGEVFVSPENANGTYVVDGTMMPHGLVDTPIEFTVEGGFVTDIEDERIRKQVERGAEEVGDDAYNLAELGIGTNAAISQLVGSVLLDEKAAGTVHIAIGDDHGIGGDTQAPLHLDGILRDPTVYADGEELALPEANGA
ncbi:aminopeptidase [Halococcus sediminicola]|uniref:aminopeptidase n=1 Tax=Halococcus sediminicola TaxID=1264579 RepID=UPI000679A5C4|nr:aminopeptidase [Halococcus sediminicola]